jgi:hypothetical protein
MSLLVHNDGEPKLTDLIMLSFESGDPRWMTYQQVQAKGWRLRNSRRSSHAIDATMHGDTVSAMMRQQHISMGEKLTSSFPVGCMRWSAKRRPLRLTFAAKRGDDSFVPGTHHKKERAGCQGMI